MSKSKGNVVDPLGVASEYGTDAVRMALVAGVTAGSDIVISEDKIRGYRNFTTKIWNMARFILLNRPTDFTGKKAAPTAQDKKRLAELLAVKRRVAKHIEGMEFHLAAERVYHYVWHTFADKVVEAAKPRLRDKDEAVRAAAHYALETMFLECLKMLHPFMPFVSEELYRKFRSDRMLMVESW